MTLGMMKEVLSNANQALFFYDTADVEIIGSNSMAHYRKDKRGPLVSQWGLSPQD